MSRPRRITDDQILATMRASVLEHGPAVSLDVVAAELGVTGPALLHRFGSRQALLLKALLPPVDAPWVLDLESGPDDRPFVDQLEALLGRISEHFAAIAPCLSALRESGVATATLAEAKPGPLRAVRALTRWLVSARDRGLVAGVDHELETAAAALLGAVHSHVMMAHIYKEWLSTRPAVEYAHDLARLFARALGAAPARRPTPIEDPSHRPSGPTVP
jgi:AcrR family transcriptional regulator